MHDIDKEEKRIEKHQEILKQHLAEERLKEQSKESAGEKLEQMQENLVGKRKKKWRIW